MSRSSTAWSRNSTPDVCFNAALTSVRPLFDGTYQLGMCINGEPQTIAADYVMLALPLTALSIIDWRSPHLQQAMARHINYFDRPGHYLRATLLFERPFWRDVLPGAWWMLDAFDGCCAYDEGARNEIGQWGALGFLIAGNAALGLANMSDAAIEKLCLDALPPELAIGKRLIVDSRIHRWMASVNAIPGGYPVRSAFVNHRPAASQVPGLAVVGDYMFDATLNGVLDSADAATDILLAEMLAKRHVHRAETTGIPAICQWFVGGDEAQDAVFDAGYLARMLDPVWGVRPGARILNIGSGRGRVVTALRALGFDAIGIEPNRSVWSDTPKDAQAFNLCCTLDELHLPAGYFDVVLDTGLCRFERAQLGDVLKEGAAGDAARAGARIRHHRSADRVHRAQAIARRHGHACLALGLVGPAACGRLRLRAGRSAAARCRLEAVGGSRRRAGRVVRGSGEPALLLLRCAGGRRAGPRCHRSGRADRAGAPL